MGSHTDLDFMTTLCWIFTKVLIPLPNIKRSLIHKTLLLSLFFLESCYRSFGNGGRYCVLNWFVAKKKKSSPEVLVSIGLREASWQLDKFNFSKIKKKGKEQNVPIKYIKQINFCSWNNNISTLSKSHNCLNTVTLFI